MSDPVLDEEIAGSLRNELFEVTIGATVYRFTSGTRDVVVDGVIYTAEAVDRSAAGVPAIGKGGDQTIEIPIRPDHPIVKRWLWNGVPPKTATVVIRKLYASNISEPLWQGTIVALEADNANTKLHVSGMLGPPVRKRLPTITAGRQCQNVLYDDACKVDRNSFKVSTTVLAIDGRRVRINFGDLSRDYDWFELGELVHVASGERMTIRDQDDDNSGVSTLTWLDIQQPIYGMKVGDAVDVYAGCFHGIDCATKFNNMINYVGMPAMPTRNPFFRGGFGVMESK